MNEENTKPEAKAAKTVKARVLVGCAYGQPDDVAEIDADHAKDAQAQGLIDTDKAAVAYAVKLQQNQPKKKA